VHDWLVEWKYDGIRAQIVKRGGQVWIWSRGEELVTERFPEVVAAAHAARRHGARRRAAGLAARRGHAGALQSAAAAHRRKTLTKKVLADAPVVFVAYDLLEDGGVDLRGQPQQPAPRRAGSAAPAGRCACRPAVAADDWAAWPRCASSRARARRRRLHAQAPRARYGSGRTKADGTWWKWKIDPMTVDGVLIYAQAGHGRRAGVYTDYTFAVWSRPPADAAEAQAVVEAIARANRRCPAHCSWCLSPRPTRA
jgi:DNA ligase 1